MTAVAAEAGLSLSPDQWEAKTAQMKRQRDASLHKTRKGEAKMLQQLTGRMSTMWQNSRSSIAGFGPALVLALAASSGTFGQNVRSNYMPGTDFAKYHTYAWADEVQGVPVIGVHPGQILDTEIGEQIDSQMVAKGFTKVDSDKADLILTYGIVLDREKSFDAIGMGTGLGWRGMPYVTGSTSDINIGTLVLRMYDPTARQIVWIGAAQHTIEPSKSQEKNQEHLSKGMHKLLKDFPPPRR
jgi:hypothetical protein